MRSDPRPFTPVTRRQLFTVAGCAFAVRQLHSQSSVPAAKPTLPPLSQQIHYDDDGLIVHLHTTPDGKRVFDGGDTAQREGWYWVGRWVRDYLNDPWPIKRDRTFPEVIDRLEPKKDGIFYRHPKLAPWNNPRDKEFGFSIDQMTPLMAAMGLWSQSDPDVRAALVRLWNALPQDPLLGTKHTFNGPKIEVFGQHIAWSGDLVFGKFINLYRRALGEDPIVASDGNGPFGEADLSGLVCLRTNPPNLNDVGDDLNLIVMLVMAILRHSSPCPGPDFTIPSLPPIPGLEKETQYLHKIQGCQLSTCTDTYVNVYRKRAASYGSYLEAYRTENGDDDGVSDDELRRRLDAGIKKGWKPDKRTVLGAVRWYHRSQIGANPQLADLYDPIIRRYFEA